MPYIDVPERQLHMYYTCNTLAYSADVAGHEIDPSKPNLVLIHASMSSSENFSAQFADQRFTRSFNLIALDARLHGRTSGADRIKHVLEDSAFCVIYALDTLGIATYHLVGEGFHGSHICSWIAIRRPEKVKSITLVSPGPFYESAETIHELVDEWLPAALANKDGKGDGSGSIDDKHVHMMSNYFFSGINRQQERQERFCEAFKHRYGRGHNSHDIKHLINFFRRQPIPANLLAAVKAPVLILQGEEDKIASPTSAAEAWRDSFKSARGGADLRVIAGAPHLLLFTDFSIANRFIVQFVQRNL